jgi:hypothetical protein
VSGLRVSRHCFIFTGEGTYDYRVKVKKNFIILINITFKAFAILGGYAK